MEVEHGFGFMYCCLPKTFLPSFGKPVIWMPCWGVQPHIFSDVVGVLQFCHGDVLPLNVRLVCSELAWKFAERLLSLLQTLMVPGLNSRIGQGVCQEALLSNITHTLIFRVLRLDA